MLVALPQSPEHRRLDRHPGNARVARDRVLERMVGEGRVSAADAMQAKSVSVPKLRKPMPILAPHSADQATSLHRDRPIIKLALDAGIQRALEGLARDRAATLGNNISIGLIAVDNESGDVLAHVGFARLFRRSPRRAGRYDPRGAFSGARR